ncbi:unnamed protein product [Sympodiomycopsis kandeliae]
MEERNKQKVEHQLRLGTPPQAKTSSSLSVLKVVFAIISLLLAYAFANHQKLLMSSSMAMSLNSDSQQVSRHVMKKVEAIETPEGQGATVRRSIGTPSLRNLSPFLMLDHFKIGLGAGFPDHPHRGQTTWTYMLEGYVQHEDFLGNSGTIGPGDLQHMMAAKGMMHAEMPKHFDDQGNRLPDPIGLQLWVDLPKHVKSQNPEYQEMSGKDLPVVTPRSSDEGHDWKVKVIAGRSHGMESPVVSPKNGGTWWLDIRLETAGSKLFQEIPTGWTSFMYTLGPAPIKLGGQGEHFQQYHTLVLNSDDKEANGVWIENAGKENQEARLMLFAAQPLDQEVFQYGPFVVSEKDHIRKAVLDFQMGINGFEKAPGWKSKIGNR